MIHFSITSFLWWFHFSAKLLPLSYCCVITILIKYKHIFSLSKLASATVIIKIISFDVVLRGIIIIIIIIF